ncbi:MAG: hypothetical protein H6906_03440 [Hyphomicrobiales bacterium]|nr:hypothetical protein [Hyphomicrobiales bacterium]
MRSCWNKADRSDIEIDLVARNGRDKVVRTVSSKRSAAALDATALHQFGTPVDRFL